MEAERFMRALAHAMPHSHKEENSHELDELCTNFRKWLVFPSEFKQSETVLDNFSDIWSIGLPTYGCCDGVNNSVFFLIS